jgi:hypothetical protein
MTATLFSYTGDGASVVYRNLRDLDRDIDHMRADAQVVGPEDRRRRIAELNRRIAIFNIRTPVRSAQKLPLGS